MLYTLRGHLRRRKTDGDRADSARRKDVSRPVQADSDVIRGRRGVGYIIRAAP